MKTWVTTSEEKPEYEHDCENCVFLGHIVEKGPSGRRAQSYDLYYCTQAPLIPTVIARYGDEGAEYSSGLEIAKALAEEEEDDPLVFAMEEAQRRGLLTEEQVVAEPQTSKEGNHDWAHIMQVLFSTVDGSLNTILLTIDKLDTLDHEKQTMRRRVLAARREARMAANGDPD
jgi:hypothetical protein